MAPIALTDAQLDQVMTQAHQVPRALRDMYLQAVAERLRGKPGRVARRGGGYARNPDEGARGTPKLSSAGNQ